MGSHTKIVSDKRQTFVHDIFKISGDLINGNLFVSLCQHNFKVKWGSNIREFKKQQDAMPETTPQINDVFGEMKIIMLHMQHCQVS